MPDGVSAWPSKEQAPVRSDHAQSTHSFERSGDHAEQPDRPPNRGELCVKEFSESVSIDDLKKFELHTLIIHGEDGPIVQVWGLSPPLNAICL